MLDRVFAPRRDRRLAVAMPDFAPDMEVDATERPPALRDPDALAGMLEEVMGEDAPDGTDDADSSSDSSSSASGSSFSSSSAGSGELESLPEEGDEDELGLYLRIGGAFTSQ